MARPSKYGKIDLEQVEKLAGLGLIDTEIASVLGISESTLNNYKKKPEFLEALKRGKLKADAVVIESLYKRATGYEHNAVKIFMPAGASKPIYAPYVEHYPPDSTAMIFWLKNRRVHEWRDRQETEHTFGRDELNKVMAAYAEAFVSHPGQGVVAQGNRKGAGESGEV